MKYSFGLRLALATCLLAAPGLVGAQTGAPFAGKTITIVVGYSVGGGFDLYARDLARYFGKYIPGNPSVVVENMPGAATLVSVRHLDSGAPTDGTVITEFDPGLITTSLTNPELTKTKLTDYHWVGNLSRESFICYSSLASGVKTFDDLLSREKFIMGTTSKGSDAYVNEAILGKVLHAPIVQVAGYAGSSEQRMAIERGELEGNCGDWVSMPPDWISGHKINVLVRFAENRPNDMPDTIPYVLDLAKTADQKAIIKILSGPGAVARPFIVSKRVPDANLQVLRTAFDAVEKDPGFLADLQKQSLSFDPISGAEAETLIEELYQSATPSMIAEIKDVLN